MQGTLRRPFFLSASVDLFLYRLMCPAPSWAKPAVKGRVRRRAPQGHDPPRVQILRLGHHSAVRARNHLCRGTQWIRQIQCGGRALLGHGRTGRENTARRQDGRRHLRRHHRASAARPRRGLPHDRQLRWCASHRVRRSHHHPDHVPKWRQRVPDQWRHLPAAGHPGIAVGLRHRARDARHRRAGAARLGTPRRSDGAAGLHRGSGGRTQAPQAEREGAAEAGRHAGQSRPRTGSDRRTAPSAQALGAAGSRCTARRRHPGGPARCQAPPARRRSGDPARGAADRGRRRGRTQTAQGDRRGRAQGDPRPGGRTRGRGAPAGAPSAARTADLVRAVTARRAGARDRISRRRAGEERERGARRRAPGP